MVPKTISKFKNVLVSKRSESALLNFLHDRVNNFKSDKWYYDMRLHKHDPLSK